MRFSETLPATPRPILASPFSPYPAFALLGGCPAFAEPLHVGRPNIGDRVQLAARFDDLLDRRWLTNGGRYVEEFERRLEHLLGVRHAIAMCNATAAIEIAIRALGLTGEVIVPSFTFVATVHAIEWMGLTPVFCDIDPATHNLDPACVEACITPRTSAVLGVHVWGRPCAVDALIALTQRKRLRLLFDGAHAFGCTHRGRPLGGFGDAEIFSFHATKFVNCGEGGALTTNDDALAARVRLMRNFGFIEHDTVASVGTNAKMPELSAAMGLTSLDAKSSFIEINRANYAAYTAGLQEIPGISLMRYDVSERNNYQYVVIEVDADRAGISRDLLHRVLHAENVLARRYFHPGCHRMAPYRDAPETIGDRLAHTERLTGRVLSLPSGTAVGEREIAIICSLIRGAVAAAPALRAIG